MAARRTTHSRPLPPNDFIVGRVAFERISAIEGIEPTSESRRRAKEFDDRDLSAEERRRAIVAAHRPRQD